MVTTEVPLSILDLAIVGRDDSIADALNATVGVAQAAEERGFRRVWYAEHHNMSTIASAATSVLIAHVAANTETIALGAGGIMLPNHSPLLIAEQFGTLASLHPGRIELGLGRAPGSDQTTARALRRDPMSGESFPSDVVELQGYLGGETTPTGVQAIPGAGTNVPITILGSSLFGAGLAAKLGLPYAFASHFAPTELDNAVALYRQQFQPSSQLDQPHVIAAMNVVVAETEDEAEATFGDVSRRRIGSFLGQGRRFSEEELDQIVESPQGRQIASMFRHRAVGTPANIKSQIDAFEELADADELIVTINATTIEARLRAVHLLADAYQ